MHQVEFIVFSARALKGTELLQKLKEIQPKIVKIIITGHPSIENAAKSVNEKADGYVLKPFNVAELLEMIKKNSLQKRRTCISRCLQRSNAQKRIRLFSSINTQTNGSSVVTNKACTSFVFSVPVFVKLKLKVVERRVTKKIDTCK